MKSVTIDLNDHKEALAKNSNKMQDCIRDFFGLTTLSDAADTLNTMMIYFMHEKNDWTQDAVYKASGNAISLIAFLTKLEELDTKRFEIRRSSDATFLSCKKGVTHINKHDALTEVGEKICSEISQFFGENGKLRDTVDNLGFLLSTYFYTKESINDIDAVSSVVRHISDMNTLLAGLYELNTQRDLIIFMPNEDVNLIDSGVMA